MNKKMKKFRQKNESHQELISKGFMLKPQRVKKQCKDCIMEISTGDNGRKYYKTSKMNKLVKSIFDKADKKRKSGKEVYFSYTPVNMMFELMHIVDINAKKDKYGNIHIEISKPKNIIKKK